MTPSTQRIYLDHNADYPVLGSAWAAYARTTAVGGNPSSRHARGSAARATLAGAREQVARALGAQTDEVVFTSGGTEAAALAILGSLPDASAHVVSSALEHKAVDDTLRRQRAFGRISWTRVEAGRDGVVSVDALSRAIRPDTRLLCVTGACNETGVLQPVRQIAELARQAGASCLCDSVQLVGKSEFHFGDSGVALATVSGHKLGAMPGIGALLVRGGTGLRAVLAGGSQEYARRPGTENVAGAASLADALMKAPMREAAGQIAALRDRFEGAVCEAIADVERVGGAAARLPNTSCLRFTGCPADALMMALDMRGIMVGTGSACASGAIEPSPILRGMGLSAEEASTAIRISLSHETTWAELRLSIAALIEIVAAVRAQQ